MTEANIEVTDLTVSKLYQIARTTNLFESFVPDIHTQMMVELDLDENFPRKEEDGDSTRVLINYTNKNQQSILYLLKDDDRLTSSFDVDNFVNNFRASDDEDTSQEDPIEVLKIKVLSLLNYSATTCLGITGEDYPSLAQKTAVLNLCKKALSAIVSCVYDDPLDIVVALQEMPAADNETIDTIVAMWITKHRS